jgi:hypothetical protein
MISNGRAMHSGTTHNQTRLNGQSKSVVLGVNIRRKLRVDPGQVEDGADLANQVIVRNHLTEAELVEQLPLISIEPPHHRPPP